MLCRGQNWTPQYIFTCQSLLLFIFFFLSDFFLYLTSPPLVVSVSPPLVGRQPARSFTLSDSVLHSAGQSLDDVIWAKGCVNTAVTWVLDVSIGLGCKTEKRIVWDWEQCSLPMIAGSLWLTDVITLDTSVLHLTQVTLFLLSFSLLSKLSSHLSSTPFSLILVYLLSIEHSLFLFFSCSFYTSLSFFWPRSFFFDSSVPALLPAACPLSALIFSSAMALCSFSAVICPTLLFMSSRGQHK